MKVSAPRNGQLITLARITNIRKPLDHGAAHVFSSLLLQLTESRFVVRRPQRPDRIIARSIRQQHAECRKRPGHSWNDYGFHSQLFSDFARMQPTTPTKSHQRKLAWILAPLH